MTRHQWSFDEVSDISGAAASLRNYLEQRDVRRCLEAAASERALGSACDVGCGYGRLTMVLREAARRVVGFEREDDLLSQARRLQPEIEWVSIQDLARLPVPDGAFDFAMSFTVLQHMSDAAARRVADELKRIARGGFVLLVEETDAALGGDVPPDWELGMTRGRAGSTYAAWMEPWKLRLSFPRQIEPGYARSDVGTYMLFAS